MKNKKVGIFTYHFSDNYGAVIQAYALKKYISDIGGTVEIINYIPDYVDNGAKIYFPSNKVKIRKNAIYFYQKGINLLDNLFGKEKKKKFELFRNEQLGVNHSYCFKNISSLEKANLNLDYGIVGSDQIWNPGVMQKPDPVYFLNFKSLIIKKLSYAASFGSATPDFLSDQDFIDNVKALDAISVREASAVEVVDNKAKINATHVPDPTFLVDDFNDLIEEKFINKGHVFSYVLRSGKGFSSVEEYCKNKLNTNLVKPKNYQRPWLNTQDCKDMGPIEWINHLYHSKLVLTNSFHGVALSILLNKDFVVIPLPGTKGALNERAFSLLKTVGLESRVLHSTNPEAIDQLILNKIDWDVVNVKSEQFRRIGRDFIAQHIPLG